MEYKFMHQDKRLDDQMIIDEQREIEEPPPTQEFIYPNQTPQQEACNDFAPTPIDKAAPSDRTKKPPAKVQEEQTTETPRKRGASYLKRTQTKQLKK